MVCKYCPSFGGPLLAVAPAPFAAPLYPARSCSFTFAFVASALGVKRKKSLPRPVSKFNFYGFSKSLMILGLRFKSLF